MLRVKANKSGVKFLPFGCGDVVVSESGVEYECANDTATILVKGKDFAPVGWSADAPPPPEIENKEHAAYVAGWTAREDCTAAVYDALDGEETPDDASEVYRDARKGAEAAKKGKKKAEGQSDAYDVGYDEMTAELAAAEAQAEAERAQNNADKKTANADAKKKAAANNNKDGKK